MSYPPLSPRRQKRRRRFLLIQKGRLQHRESNPQTQRSIRATLLKSHPSRFITAGPKPLQHPSRRQNAIDQPSLCRIRHRRQISASARRQRCRLKQRLRARSTLPIDSINVERALRQAPVNELYVAAVSLHHVYKATDLSKSVSVWHNVDHRSRLGLA